MIELNVIIDGCRNGDNRMQKELYDQYSPRFFALCRRYASDDDSAQDMLIEGFMTIFESINNYRGEGSFEGWMHRIFTYRIINYYRKNKKHQYMSIDDNELWDVPSGEDVAEQCDLRELLVKVMRKLTDEERTLFNMVALDGYTFRELGEYFNAPENTVKSRYYRIRENLQKRAILLMNN